MRDENGRETMRYASIAVHLDVDTPGSEGIGVSKTFVAENINARELDYYGGIVSLNRFE